MAKKAWKISALMLWLIVTASHFTAAEPRQLRVGCDREYPPFSVIENGLVSGFDVAVLRELSSVSGYSMEFKPGYWTTVLNSLENGEVDVVSAIIYTEERSDLFDFSIPYLTDYYTFFSRRESGVLTPEDTEDKILAILRNDAAIERFVIPGGMDKNIILTETYSEALALVRDGTADYTVAPYTLGMEIVEKLDLDDISATSRTLFPVSYRLAVKKGNSSLLYSLNDAILHISRNGVLDDLRKQWFSENTQKVPANHPIRLLMARVLLYILSGIVLAGAAFATGRVTIRSRLRSTIADRDCLLAVIDALPLGIRWQDPESGSFSENRFWFESCNGTNGFTADDTILSEPQRIVGVNGDEYWLRFKKNTFFSEFSGRPATFYLMEDVTALRTLEDSVNKLSKERTEETARMLVDTMVDPASGFFSAGFLANRLQELVAESDTEGSLFSVLVFNFAVDTVGENLKGCYVTAIRKPLRRTDYPCCTVDGRLAILLPGAGAEAARATAIRIIGALAESGFTQSMCGYSILEYPGTGRDILFQSIEA